MPETRALAERGIRFEADALGRALDLSLGQFSPLRALPAAARRRRATPEGNRLTHDLLRPCRSCRARCARRGTTRPGFVTNPFLHEWNRPVREAFDHYDPSFIEQPGPDARALASSVWTKRMYSDSVNPAVRAYFDARAARRPGVHLRALHRRARPQEGAERWKDAPFEPSYEAAVRHVDGKVRELYDYFSRALRRQLRAPGHERPRPGPRRRRQDRRRAVLARCARPTLHDFNLRIPLVRPAERHGRCVRACRRAVRRTSTSRRRVLEWLGLPPQERAGARACLGAIRGEAYDGERALLYARNSTNRRLDECVVYEKRKFVRYRRPADGAVRHAACYDLVGDPREATDLGRDAGALRPCLPRPRRARRRLRGPLRGARPRACATSPGASSATAATRGPNGRKEPEERLRARRDELDAGSSEPGQAPFCINRFCSKMRVSIAALAARSASAAGSPCTSR